MITLHGEEVKVGDKVWSLFKGWGEVVDLDEGRTTNPILVHWEGRRKFEWYTQDGKLHVDSAMPTLFWQPVKFEIPKKPKQKPKEKAWQWVCKAGDKYWLTHSYYASKEDVSEQNPATEPLEPYLPSEIEREVKG